jgi:hypothetical protein
MGCGATTEQAPKESMLPYDETACLRADATKVASLARLEAMANVEAQNDTEGSQAEGRHDNEEVLENGCRLGYSSVMVVNSRAEAQALLANIFTLALMRNPLKEIGGMLFYDEETHAIVQVLEGPAIAVRELFHEKIAKDSRHTSVKVLWDLDVESRRFGGFGMKLGNTESEVLQDGAAADDQQALVRLLYSSQLTAANRGAAYKDIESILGSAIVTNPKLHIGGALFLNPRTLHVQQTLEGPERAVRSLYENISKDKRHTACKVISELMVTSRDFEQWGMLQGDSSEADWSQVLKGWTNPRRRRGHDDVFAEEVAALSVAGAE